MMAEKKNEIEAKKNNEVEKKEDIGLIRRMFAKGASEDEFRVFLELAKRYNLDPFKRQIYLLKSSNSNEPATIMTSHAGLIHIAHESGKWAGMKTLLLTKSGKEVLVCDPEDIAGAVCYIWRTDWKEPLIHAVSFNEYYRRMPQGRRNIWDEKPATMIKKVAEAGALRRAFDLGGLYTEDEMDVNYSPVEYEEDVPEQPKQTKKKELPKNNVTYLALLKRIKEVEERFDVKNLQKQLEKKLNKKLEQFTERQLKQAINAVDRLEAKKIEEMQQNTISDEDIIVEEPEGTDEVDERLEEIKQIFEN
jgi:phage recombination protein Bet